MINREELQAWLDAQPEDREFRPRRNDECPIYFFLTEEKGYPRVRVFPDDVHVYDEKGNIAPKLLPSWATDVQDRWMRDHFDLITAKQAADEMRGMGDAKAKDSQ